MTRMLLLAAVWIATGTAAHAQSVPPITRSKQVATKAADAASERVRRQESVTAETPSADSTRSRTGPDGKAPSGASSRQPAPNTTASRPGATPTRSRTTASPDTAASRRPGSAADRTPSAPDRTPASRTTPARRGSAAGAAVDSVRPEGAATRNELVLMREVYRYDDGGRRDPFLSLMESGELRPVVSDLRLIGVIYDPTGRRSLATLRDVTTNELYRVAVGNVLGRTRVTHIQPKQITMTIEEFGFSRQLVLILGDTTGTRTER